MLIYLLFLLFRVNWESENANLYHPTSIVEKSLELLANITTTTAATGINATSTTTTTPITELLPTAEALQNITATLETSTLALATSSLATPSTLLSSSVVETTTPLLETTTTIISNVTERIANVKLINADNLPDLSAARHQYMYIYAIMMLVVLYLVFQRAIIFYSMCLKASRKLHDKLFRGIIRAPMYFYNANSSGRIMNRFSKDINNVDTALPMALFDSLMVCDIVNSLFGDLILIFVFRFQFVLQFSATLILVSISNIWLLVPTFFISLVFYTLRSIYINTARCVKRIEATCEYYYIH